MTTSSELSELLASLDPQMRDIVSTLQALLCEVVPSAQVEVDVQGRMLGYTFIPGTYRGLFAALVVHRAHVNLMFSNGVALLPRDSDGLLSGTGKRARHIRFSSVADVARPGVRTLVATAANLAQQAM